MTSHLLQWGGGVPRMLSDVSKPSWSSLVDKLRGMKPSVYEVSEVATSQGLQKAKDQLTRLYGRSKRVSVLIIQH
jgi:hypothetical protein